MRHAWPLLQDRLRIDIGCRIPGASPGHDPVLEDRARALEDSLRRLAHATRLDLADDAEHLRRVDFGDRARADLREHVDLK